MIPNIKIPSFKKKTKTEGILQILLITFSQEQRKDKSLSSIFAINKC